MPKAKRGETEIIGDKMFVGTGYLVRTEVVEHLMGPVMPFIAERVRVILTAAAKMFPNKCPHCGGEIFLQLPKPTQPRPEAE